MDPQTIPQLLEDAFNTWILLQALHPQAIPQLLEDAFKI